MRLAALLVFAACSHAAPQPAAPAGAPATPSASSQGDIAPQLFTVDQLRAASPSGRVIEFRMEVEGKPTIIDHWEFTSANADTVTIHAVRRDEVGNVVSDESQTAAWVDLHKHGQFPAAATTIQDNVQLTIPAGTFTTRLYTVKTGDSIRRLWFATDLPGPPVQFTTEQAGKVVMRATMLRAR